MRGSRAVGIAFSCLGIAFGAAWAVVTHEALSVAPPILTPSEQRSLLALARQALEAAAAGEAEPSVHLADLPKGFRRTAAAFVTLSKGGALRGCMIDEFSRHEPLCQNVLRNTVLAATGDPRFPPVSREEVLGIRIEISVLGRVRPLSYAGPADLLWKLKPGEDGVILATAEGTSTFLPQVWQTFPDPAQFLTELCLKLGVAADRWTLKPEPAVSVYRVLHFAEPSPPGNARE
ncbi:MAG: AmmeMemoRadiSam system protein A [Candidatus Bipolaricaulota bacterium]|nr:AmmeMemoRadiSam system protein A [Candidatus Bipolaricaulota bacterium]